jgi:bifunctional DNA-binding transcriptional regulator/antitoxin component of YhaV-PrlF toxin-antitoxin module
MTTLTVTAKGQVTLRQELLRHLGVQPGQQIEVTALPGGRIEVSASHSHGSIDAFIGRLAGRSAKVATLEQIQAAATSGWAGES